MDTKTYKNDGGIAQQLEIKNIFRHPEYDEIKRYHDIALIELENEVAVTDFVIPACLWNKERIEIDKLEEISFSVGIETSLNMIKTKLAQVDVEKCRELYDSSGSNRLQNAIIDGQHLCASGLSNKSLEDCKGKLTFSVKPD